MQEWTIWRVSDDALRKLAQKSVPANTLKNTRPDAGGRA